MNAGHAPPPLFGLMARLTAAERQKFAERRRALKARAGIEERLVETEKGEWQLEYWSGPKRVEVLAL